MAVTLTLAQLAALTGAELRGDPEGEIHGLAPLETAGPGQLSFLANPRYRQHLSGSQAGAVLLQPDEAGHFAGNALLVDHPYAAFARLTHVFDPAPRREAGVAASAVIDPTAEVHPSAAVAAGVVVEAGAVIGAGCVLEPGVVVGAQARLGEQCWIGANAVIHHHCQLGDRVRVHAGAIIGAEGFGFAPVAGHWQRIAQIGTVRIGDDCRIGANTTIDRGAVGDTVIGCNVIIDNQVQIAHNVQVGDHTAIAACCGISGSTRIGRHCVLAGGVGLVGHIEIADRVQITGMTMVTKSIHVPGSYSSGTAMSDTAQWKKMAVQLRQLPQVNLRELQQQIANMQQRLNQLESQANFSQPPGA